MRRCRLAFSPQRRSLLDDPHDQRGHLCLSPLQRTEDRQQVPAVPSGRRFDAFVFGDDGLNTREVTDQRACDAEREDMKRQLGERAGVADDTKIPGRDREEALVIPNGAGGGPRRPSPSPESSAMATNARAFIEGAGQEARLRCRKRPLRTPRGVLCQRDGALQERGCSGHAAPSLGAAGGSLQLSGDVLVGPGGGAGAVPGPSVRVGFDVGGVGERAVDPVAVVRSRGPVRGGADERVCELHALSDDEQLGIQRGVGRRHADLESLGGA
jgi:hypothetical protein